MPVITLEAKVNESETLRISDILEEETEEKEEKVPARTDGFMREHSGCMLDSIKAVQCASMLATPLLSQKLILKSS